jgi:hypothetical protein
MSQTNKADFKVNNYFYIVINDESKIPDLKNYFSLLQPFKENHSINTFSIINTTNKESKVIIKEDNGEISNSLNTETDEGKNEKNFENKNDIIDQEKEIILMLNQRRKQVESQNIQHQMVSTQNIHMIIY